MAVHRLVDDKLNAIRAIKRLLDKYDIAGVCFDDLKTQIGKLDVQGVKALLLKQAGRSLVRRKIMELRQIAQGLGIKNSSRKTKEELIELITEAKNSANELWG